MCANGRTANGSAVTRVGGHTTVTRRLHSTRPAAALRLHSVARRSHGGRTPATHAGTPGVLARTGAHSRRTRAVTTSTPGLRATPPAPLPPSVPNRVPSGGCGGCGASLLLERKEMPAHAAARSGSAARGRVSGGADSGFAAQRLCPGHTGAGGSPSK
jgi:hypothetical protein